MWSALDEQGYCSEECYRKPVDAPTAVYVAHGAYEIKEENNA